MNTVEGVIRKAVEGLAVEQPYRHEHAPEIAQQIDAVISQLNAMADGNALPFTFEIDDPSGNSFVSFDTVTYIDPGQDPKLTLTQYNRTKEQMVAMGYIAEDMPDMPDIDSLQLEEQKAEEEVKISAQNMDFSEPIDENRPTEEGMEFETPCYSCFKPGVTRMCIVNVPHFKEVVIMAFACEFCGAKSNEVKGGGAISERGLEIRLTVSTL
jgi:zinc finger protein